MIRLQLLTAARPGEICAMKAAELVMSGRVWMYEPAQHKTQHRGHRRRIPLGPKAQEIVRPFLVGNPAEPLFKPCDAERERNEARQDPDRQLTPSAPSPATSTAEGVIVSPTPSIPTAARSRGRVMRRFLRRPSWNA